MTLSNSPGTGKDSQRGYRIDRSRVNAGRREGGKAGTARRSRIHSFLLSSAACACAVFLAGCGLGNAQFEPIERTTTVIIDKVVIPVTSKLIEETSSRSGQLIGGAQAINPGYQIDISGKLVQGFEARVVLRTIGLAGQLQGAGQFDQGPDLGVAKREEEPPGEPPVSQPGGS